MVDDEDGDGFPSPKPRTDSRSALLRGFRAWRRLRIVKRDDFFSLIFSPRNSIYGGGVGVQIGKVTSGVLHNSIVGLLDGDELDGIYHVIELVLLGFDP